MCLNFILEDALVTTIISSTIASDTVIGICFVCYILLLLIREMIYVIERPSFMILKSAFSVFTVPLLIMIGYTVIIWSAKILTY